MSHRVPITEEVLKELQKEIEPLVPWMDFLGDHVVITDENGNVVYANKVALEKTGFSSEEIVGKNPGDLWGGGKMSREQYAEMWHTIKTLKQPFVGEVENKRKDGTRYWQELRISPVLDSDKNVRFFIGVEPDITARKHMEHEASERYALTRRWDRMLAEKNFTVAELQRQIEDLKRELKKV